MRLNLVLDFLALAALAAACLRLGVRGLLGSRPLVFSERWLFGLVFFVNGCLGIANVIALSAGLKTGLELDALLLVLQVLVMLLAVFAWPRLTGHLVFGVSASSARGAVLHALDMLELKFEEKESVFHLPAESLELHLSAQAWLGTAQFKQRPSKGKQRGAEFAAQVTDYFAITEVERNKTCFWLLTSLGFSTTVLAASLLWYLATS